MTPEATTLAPFYQGWNRYQGLLTETISPLSPDHLLLSAAESLRPAWVLVAHIIAARVVWFHHVLGEGDPAIAPLRTWDDDGMPARDAVELGDGLNATWQIIQSCLDRWTPEMLDDPFVSTRGTPRTRQWVIWHVLEHDLHHGGELSFTLGMHGLPVPEL